MDGNHPKRRKDKYNPYTIGTTGDGRHWLTFSDGQGNRHHFEISAAVFALFDSFELDDLSYLNEVDRHYEQSELTEASLYDRAMHRPATVEESALQSMEYAAVRFFCLGDPRCRRAVPSAETPLRDGNRQLDVYSRCRTLCGAGLYHLPRYDRRAISLGVAALGAVRAERASL